MKKIYTILSLLLCTGAGANAQRLIDIQTTLTSPANGSTITSGQTVQFNTVIKNLGSQTLKTTDSVFYQYSINGSPITFSSGSQTFSIFYATGKQIAVNDTIQINQSFALNFNTSLNGKQQFCITALPVNRSTDSVADHVTTNNASCDSLIFSSTTTGIGTIEGTVVTNSITNVYPNPASNQVNIDLDLSAGAMVSVKVFDLMGRTIMTTEQVRYGKGKQTISLNTANLSTGLYLYQVVMDNNTSSGKLYISK